MKLDDLKRKATQRAARLMEDPRVQQAFIKAMQTGENLREEFVRVKKELREATNLRVEDDTVELKRKLDEIRRQRTERSE